MAGKVDRLFLERGCPACAAVRASVSMDTMISDSVLGADGQQLHVFGALSAMASADMLDHYNQSGQRAPLLVKDSGEALSESNRIVAYLKQQGFGL